MTQQFKENWLLASMQHAVVAITLGVAALQPLAASAQAWPSKPIKVIVNFPAGGAADQIARAVAMPLQEALDRQLISEDEKAEVMNLLAFFIVSSLVAPKADRPILIHGMAAIYRLEVTSSSFLEWANSFKTRMLEESSGENQEENRSSGGTSTT